MSEAPTGKPVPPCPKSWAEVSTKSRFEWICHREYLAAGVWPPPTFQMHCHVGGSKLHPVAQIARYREGVKRMANALVTMATARGMSTATFVDSIKKAVGLPNITTDQLGLYIATCEKYDLDPMTGEVWMLEKSGKCSVNIGVDGWSKLVNREPQYNGCDFQYEFHEGELQAVTCRMYRKDRTHATEVTEWMIECKQNSRPWQSHPNRMLRHKAFVQAARISFAMSTPSDEVTVQSLGMTHAEFEGVAKAVEMVEQPQEEEVFPDIAEEAAADEEQRAEAVGAIPDGLFPDAQSDPYEND